MKKNIVVREWNFYLSFNDKCDSDTTATKRAKKKFKTISLCLVHTQIYVYTKNFDESKRFCPKIWLLLYAHICMNVSHFLSLCVCYTFKHLNSDSFDMMHGEKFTETMITFVWIIVKVNRKKRAQKLMKDEPLIEIDLMTHRPIDPLYSLPGNFRENFMKKSEIYWFLFKKKKQL